MCVFFFPPPPHLQPAAELEIQAKEISGQKTEDGGQTAWPGDQVNSFTVSHRIILMSLPDSRLNKSSLFFSLSSGEEEGSSEEEGDKKKEGEEEEEDEEAEMERKLTELKAEEVAELKRCDTESLFW